MPAIIIKDSETGKEGVVNELSTCEIQGELKYKTIAIAGSQLTVATLNIYDSNTEEAIGAADRDILNKISEEGVLAMTIAAADNLILSVSPNTEYETHVFCFHFEGEQDGEPIVLNEEAILKVKNLRFKSSGD